MLCLGAEQPLWYWQPRKGEASCWMVVTQQNNTPEISSAPYFLALSLLLLWLIGVGYFFQPYKLFLCPNLNICCVSFFPDLDLWLLSCRYVSSNWGITLSVSCCYQLLGDLCVVSKLWQILPTPPLVLLSLVLPDASPVNEDWASALSGAKVHPLKTHI